MFNQNLSHLLCYSIMHTKKNWVSASYKCNRKLLNNTKYHENQKSSSKNDIQITFQ